MDHTPETKQRRYIGSVALAKRYDRAARTVARWTKEPPPGFPKPVRNHRLWLWDVAELDAYDDAMRSAG